MRDHVGRIHTAGLEGYAKCVGATSGLQLPRKKHAGNEDRSYAGILVRADELRAEGQSLRTRYQTDAHDRS